ncbi:hypothetical protein RYX36_009646 [Vicia faba]
MRRNFLSTDSRKRKNEELYLLPTLLITLLILLPKPDLLCSRPTSTSCYNTFLQQSMLNATLTIPSTYRSHCIRTLYLKISTVDPETDHLQRLI